MEILCQLLLRPGNKLLIPSILCLQWCRWRGHSFCSACWAVLNCPLFFTSFKLPIGCHNMMTLWHWMTLSIIFTGSWSCPRTFIFTYLQELSTSHIFVCSMWNVKAIVSLAHSSLLMWNLKVLLNYFGNPAGQLWLVILLIRNLSSMIRSSFMILSHQLTYC